MPPAWAWEVKMLNPPPNPPQHTMPTLHTMPDSDKEAQAQAEKICRKCRCLWQMKAACATQDVVTISPTGAGKTFAYFVLALVKEWRRTW